MKKIEKLENGDYSVTAEFENSNEVNIYIEVNKYSVSMPSAVAEYFFAFAKKGNIVTNQRTITKNGNKCVFTLSFDTADAATMTVTAGSQEAIDAYQAGEYQEAETEICNNAAEEAEKIKKRIESIKQTAEEKAADKGAADETETADKVEKAEKVKMPRCLCGEMIIQADAKTLGDIQENKGVPKVVKEILKNNNGKLLNIEKDEARALFAVIVCAQQSDKNKYFSYQKCLSEKAKTKAEMLQLIKQGGEIRGEIMPPYYSLRLADIAKCMYQTKRATNNQVTEVAKLLNSLSSKKQIGKAENTYFFCRLVDIIQAEKKQGQAEIVQITLGWLTYWKVATNYALNAHKYYLGLTKEKKYNTPETQYINTALTANSGKEKFSLEKNKIAQFANGGHNKKRSEINTLRTLDRMKADKQINNYIEKNKVAAKKADIIEIENNCNCIETKKEKK